MKISTKDNNHGNFDDADVPDPYMKTRGGALLTFSAPEIEQIRTHDIAWAICNIMRFTGHTELVVGQHVVEVSRFVYAEFEPDDPERIEAALVGIAHDFHEGYLGDVSSPLKSVIRGDFRNIDNRFADAIHRRYGLENARAKYHAMVKRADMRCLYEDAVRFNMDGVRHDYFTGEDTVVPNVWVPADFVSVLPKIVLSPREAELSLWRNFVALMVGSGRGALL